MPIATGVAIALALGSAGAQAGASMYGAKKAADTNKRSLETDERMAAQERVSRDAAYKAALAQDDRNYQRYYDANAPQWRMGQQVLGSLYDLAGGGPQGAPNPDAAPYQPAQPMSRPTPTPPPVSGQPMAPQGRPSPMRRPMMNGPAPPPRMSLMDLASMGQAASRPQPPPAWTGAGAYDLSTLAGGRAS